MCVCVYGYITCKRGSYSDYIICQGRVVDTISACWLGVVAIVAMVIIIVVMLLHVMVYAIPMQN